MWQQLTGRGWTLIPGASTADVVSELIAEYERLALAADHGFYASCNDAERPVARAVDLAIRRITAGIVSEHFPGYEPFLASFVSKGSPMGEMDFHQDLTYVDEGRFRSLLLWIPLVDVDDRSGALRVVEGSHHWTRSIRAGGHGELATAALQDVFASMARTVPADAGDAVVFDHAVVHGSAANDAGVPRPAAALALKPVEAQLVHFHVDLDGSRGGFEIDESFFTTNEFRSRPTGESTVGFWGPLLTAAELARAASLHAHGTGPAPAVPTASTPVHAARRPNARPSRLHARMPGTPKRVVWLNEGAASTDPWTAAHGVARHEVQNAHGLQVETTFLEEIRPQQAGAAITDAVEAGAEVVVATSFGLAAATSEAARLYPDVRFEQARGVEVLENLSTFAGAQEEATFLAGVLAGARTASGLIGYVGTVPEPETVRHVNAFTLGARLVDPDVQVHLMWSHDWWHMDRERGLAEHLVAEGADVLATGCTSPATGHAAVRAGVDWCAHDADRSTELGFRDVWLTASVTRWSTYLVQRIGQVLSGTWSAGAFRGGIADGFTDLAPLGRRVSPEERRFVAWTRERIVRGELDVFAGPVFDLEGDLRVASGCSATLQERLTMDWLVEGTIDVPVDY